MDQKARPALDRGPVERQGRPIATTDAPGVAVSMPGLTWYAPPLQLYLQQSASFLLCGRWVGVRAPEGAFPYLFQSTMGITMTFEPAAQEPRGEIPAIDLLPHERLCDSLVVLNLHFGHERFAAMRRASELSPVLPESAYRAFESRLALCIDGTLDEGEATRLVADIVEHTLRLTGCTDVHMDELVHAALQYTDEHRNFRVGEIAGALHISSQRLSHLFTENTGFSFRRYTTISRALRAWELVALAPELTLTEIAHMLEFTDLAHMSNAFRTTLHAPPSEFRDPGRYRIHGRPSSPGQRVSPRLPDAPRRRTAQR